MVYIKEFYKFRRKARVITFDNINLAEEYLKRARGVKWHIYETEESYKRDDPDQFVIKMKIGTRKNKK